MKRISSVTFVYVAVALFVAAYSVAGQQKASGRSAAGSLSLSMTDSVVAAAVLKNRSITYEFEFSEPSGNKYLDPRETGRLRVVLTNNGKVAVRNVVVKIVPLGSPLQIAYNDSIVVGDIPVNATRYAIFYFSAGENLTAQILTFQVNIRDPHGPVADARLFTFLTRERRPGN
jgi:hypothetical protein